MKTEAAKYIGVCITYIFLALAFTWPMPVGLTQELFGDSEYPFDTYASLHAVAKDSTPLIVNYPWGDKNSIHLPQPFVHQPIRFFQLFTNHVGAYNIFILLSFIAGAMACYVLCLSITANHWASFIAGFIFGFSPYHTLKCFAHHGLALTVFLPLCLLCFIRFVSTGTWKNLTTLATILILTALGNYYYAYIAGITFSLTWIILAVHNRFTAQPLIVHPQFNNLSSQERFFQILFCATALFSTGLVCFYGITHFDSIKTAFFRPFSDLIRYRASLLSYVTPSEYNPILGFAARTVFPNKRFWNESTLYLGIIPICLSLFCIYSVYYKKGISEKLKNTVSIILITILVAFFLSLGPYLDLVLIKIPNLPYLLYYIFPMFRVYSRFGILVILGVSILAGTGLHIFIDSKIEKTATKGVLILTTFFLIYGEYTVSPPARINPLTILPVYESVKNNPEITAVAEYPIFSSIDERHYDYLLGQIHHGKPLMNGPANNQFQQKFKKTLNDITQKNVWLKLKLTGISHVLMHKKHYSQEDIKKVILSPAMEILFEDTNTILLANHIDIPDFYYEKIYFYGDEMQQNGSTWNWVKDSAYLFIYAKTPSIKSLSFSAVSFREPRELTISLNEQIVLKSMISASEVKQLSEKLTLPRGISILEFSSAPDSNPVSYYNEGNDKRIVSVQIGNLSLSPASSDGP